MKRKIVQSDSEGEDNSNNESSDAESQHETEIQVRRRSERQPRSRIPETGPKKSALEILDEIEQEDEEDVGVWKEETEEERRRRLNFVVDDDGTGYIDDDVDHDGREYAQSDDDDDEQAVDTTGKKKKKKLKKLGDVNARAELQKTTILDMFAKSAARRSREETEASSSASAVEIKPTDVQLSVDDSLADLLVSAAKPAKKPAMPNYSRPAMHATRPLPSSSAPRARPFTMRSVAPTPSSSTSRQVPKHFKPEQTVSEPSNYYEDGPDFTGVEESRPEPKQEVAAEPEIKEPEQTQQPVVEAKPAAVSARSRLLALASSAPLPSAAQKQVPAPVKPVEPAPAMPVASRPLPEASISLVGGTDLPVMSSTQSDGNLSTSSSIQQTVFPSKPVADKPEKEVIELYWMDMWDERNLPGEIYMFGRTDVPETSNTASALVILQNVQRCLYFLPRGDGASDEEGRKAIQEEALNAVRSRLAPEKREHVRLRSKWVERSYAFELPDIPRGKATYLMVQYSMGLETRNAEPFAPGKTFAHVFGANQSAIERFLLANKLMGPCWLQIESTGIRKDKVGKSHGKFEAVVDLEAPGTTITILQKKAAPSMSMLSLALKTVVDPTSHQHQIVAATGVLHPEVALDAGKPPTSKEAVVAFQIVRPVSSENLPAGFASQNPNVSCVPNERALLSLLLAKLHIIDPDILMGHNIEGFELDLLLTRTKHFKIGQWSKLGRLNLREHPRSKKSAGGRSSHYGVLTPGRLLLDTYKAAQEFVMNQREYSLSSLCENLGLTPPNRRRVDLDPAQVPDYFRTRESLNGLLRHNIETAQLALELAFKLEAVTLTFELTTIAGNLWRRTLGAGRAERIEYLLLHAFHNQDYIVPDKEEYSMEKKRKNAAASKKAGYSGGLVLEPKAGLYDTFVVLLDFNALYPSIIQEYNICFTTVARPAIRDEDDSGEARKKSRTSNENGEEEDEDDQMEGEHDEDEEGNNAANQEEEEVPLPADNGRGPNGLAVLPTVIKSIVDRRVQVKNQLSSETDPSKRRQLDTRQKALKITANSMYGCLGFRSSRFFAKPIASLITSRGRLILQDTVETTKQLGYEVVYGDTDSIMIDTRLRAESSPLVPKDLEPVSKIAEDIQKAVNPKYKYLKIALDGVFGTLLLLKKKKYAALALSLSHGAVHTKRETKGLDLVRRDWCLASRDVGSQILDLILSGKSREDVVEGIRGTLLQFKEDTKVGKVGMEKWTVTKGLNKSPRDYPDAKGQPHLQVALAMMTKGKVVNTGDHIPYVICTKTRNEVKVELEKKHNGGENVEDENAAPVAPSSSSLRSSFADRAFHPEEVKQYGLEIDIDWYMVTQILPPVQRLCEVIDGVSSQELAEALGLDSTKFKASMPVPQVNPITARFDEVFGNSFAADLERFSNCEKLEVECPSCSLKFAIPGVFWLPEEKKKALNSTEADASLTLTPGNCCPKCSSQVLDGVVLQNMLVLAARKAIRTYHQGWLVSDDPTASDLKTRQQSLRNMFPFNGKRVQLHRKYTGKDLWIQLLYLLSIVDWRRANASLIRENDHRKKSGLSPFIAAHTDEQIEALHDAKNFFENAFLRHSGFGWVAPDFFSKVFRVPQQQQQRQLV